MARDGKQEAAPEPRPEPRPQPQMAPDLRAAFDDAALKIASQFQLDLNDVKAAYNEKPESLTRTFESMADAKSDRQSWIGWTVAWTVLGAVTAGALLLAAAYTGYKAYEEHQKIEEIGAEVQTEVSSYKRANDGGQVPQVNGPS